MGYTTDFSGEVSINPPLNKKEIEYLQKFNQTRRMSRMNGPYFVDGTGDYGQGRDSDILDFNRPPEGQPGLWCNWTPTEDGTAIEWDGGEKFYNAEKWMAYLIKHFVGSDPIAKREHPEEFSFLQGHDLNGRIDAQGEDYDDKWLLIVENNKVKVADVIVTYDIGSAKEIT